jgi:SAM-dependent methyltransferase
MRTLFEQELDSELVSLNQAVSLLGICAATLRNWVKHNYLKTHSMGGKLAFDLQQIKDLKSKIETGEISRLNRRANKKQSAITFVPTEYADSPAIISAVECIAETFRRERLDIKTTLFAVAQNILTQEGLVEQSGSRELALSGTSNEALRKELDWWYHQISDFSSPAHKLLLDYPLPRARDFLGLLYQSLSNEGAKTKGGTYYTPKRVVDSIVNDYIHENSTILDPCCGTGQFLLAAAERTLNPSNLWGFDVDEIAVRVARLNIIRHFPNADFEPNIYCENTLLAFPFFASLNGKELPRFDVIFTNPPWGAHFSAAEVLQLKKLFPSVKSNEAFALFLQRGLQLLREGGVLCYILPESFLNIKIHADIRKIVSQQTRIRQVIHLGRIFKNVFTPAMRLDITKETPKPETCFFAVKDQLSFSVPQSRVTNNADCVFDVFNADEDLSIFEKVCNREKLTLAGQADWALGIVTGNNTKFLADYKDPHHEPILTGKDLRRFTVLAPKRFIHFQPEIFQQVAPIDRYRAPEKLVYRFISDQLIFAYDNGGTLSLNSANILIPFLKGYSVKAVLGFLNSSLYQFIFQKKVGSIKILRGDIEKLPFPIIDEAEHQQVLSFINPLIDPESPIPARKRAFADLDDYIMSLFDLSTAEKAHVLANARISEKSLPF